MAGCRVHERYYHLPRSKLPNQHYPKPISTTGLGFKGRFGEFCCCCCLPLLPSFFCGIHTTWAHLLAEPCIVPLPKPKRRPTICLGLDLNLSTKYGSGLPPSLSLSLFHLWSSNIAIIYRLLRVHHWWRLTQLAVRSLPFGGCCTRRCVRPTDGRRRR